VLEDGNVAQADKKTVIAMSIVRLKKNIHLIGFSVHV
jgi:hypothetical protein